VLKGIRIVEKQFGLEMEISEDPKDLE